MHCKLYHSENADYQFNDMYVDILKPSSNRSLFNLIIFDQMLIKLKCCFDYIYVHFNGQTFSSVFEQFSFTSKFFGLKMQKSTFLKKKMVLRVVFINLTFRWLQTGLSDLKNTKQLKFCLWWIFYAFLKCCIFQKFSRFLKFTSISW